MPHVPHPAREPPRRSDPLPSMPAGHQRYRKTETSAPQANPVSASATQNHPSARAIGPSSAEEPKRGGPPPSDPAACPPSSPPAALGTSRASRARVEATTGGAVTPPTVRTSGTPTRRKTTSAERGLPGS